ncbi:MAG: diaminopimelate decarboxylase [Actinomycetota bacterium]
MLLPVTSSIDKQGLLSVGGLSVRQLKEKYGTPLYVMDIATIKKQCRDYRECFASVGLDSEIIYASKAFASIASCQLIALEGLSIDVSTGGELYIALESGFEPHRIFFHGNNKSKQEIAYGLNSNVGYFIVDNFDELKLLAELAAGAGRRQKVFLRITPGIKASTHEYIQTGKVESKFGFGIHGSVAMEAVKAALSYGSLELVGIHSHIGSQIFNLSSYEKLIDVLLKFLRNIKPALGADIRGVNIGGGLGIQYTSQDKPPTVSQFAEVIGDAARRYGKKHGVEIEKMYLEPGRSIVGNAGITLYEAGSVKEIPHVKNYIAVDGGMSDNIRPILYQAKYEAFLAERMNDEPAGKTYTVVGKHCESGDVLVEDIHLPIVNKGDLIAIAATGAYCFAMSSNYNGQPRSAVVAVEDSKSWVWIERQQYCDLISGNRKLYE